MKRVLGFLLCAALLLLLGCAGAEVAISALPEEQIGCVMPAGLACSDTVSDGMLSIRIDDDKTDWAQAIASTGTGAGDAQILWQIKAPGGVQAKYVILMFADDDETAGADLLEEEKRDAYQEIKGIDGWGVPARADGMPITERGVGIAASVPELSYLVPEAYRQNVYVRWYDGAKNPLTDIQKLSVRYTHTRKEPFQTKVGFPIAKGRIKGNAQNVSEVRVLELEDGLVRYLIPQADRAVQTRLTAPSGAAQFALMGNLKSGGVYAPQPLVDGCAVIDTTRWADAPEAASGAYTIYFCDAGGGVVETVSLTICYQSSEALLPWPAYDDTLQPLPADMLTLTNGAAGAGFVVSYDESTGRLSTRYDGAMRQGSPVGQLTMAVTNEWGPYAYRLYQHGSNDLMGPGGGGLPLVLSELDQGYPNGPEAIASETVYTEQTVPYRVIVPRDDAIKIYVPQSNARYMAELYIFEFLYDPDDPTNRDLFYLWKTVEPFTLVEETRPVTTADRLPKPVSEPRVVADVGGRLLITRYFTQSENAWHYDLKLVDDAGRPQSLQAPVRVFLPYPQGHAYGEAGTAYTLNHYTDDLYRGAAPDRSEGLRVTATEYGLMFETQSFSPFILSASSAQANPPAPAQSVPKTGDATPLALLGLLLALSAAGLVLLRGRRHA